MEKLRTLPTVMVWWDVGSGSVAGPSTLGLDGWIQAAGMRMHGTAWQARRRYAVLRCATLPGDSDRRRTPPRPPVLLYLCEQVATATSIVLERSPGESGCRVEGRGADSTGEEQESRPVTRSDSAREVGNPTQRPTAAFGGWPVRRRARLESPGERRGGNANAGRAGRGGSSGAHFMAGRPSPSAVTWSPTPCGQASRRHAVIVSVSSVAMHCPGIALSLRASASPSSSPRR